jgi:hypothetical protein
MDNEGDLNSSEWAEMPTFMQPQCQPRSQRTAAYWISLTLAAVFGGNLAWSFYTGEAQQMLRHFRKGSAPDDASDEERRTRA